MTSIASLFLAAVLISITLSLGGVIAFGAGASFGSTDRYEGRNEAPTTSPHGVGDEATGLWMIIDRVATCIVAADQHVLHT